MQSHCRGPESQKRGIYFDPNGIRATITTIPVFDNIFSSDQFVALETLAAFSRGREAIRGCKVCVIKQQKRFFYVIFSKYRRGLVNFAIKGESTDQETWRGPLVVMRLDTQTASRVVSISSKFHRELAITAAARYAYSRCPYAADVSKV